MRHNNVRDCIGNMMKDVCVDVKIEPSLLPVKPNEYNTRTTTDEGARLDISACGLQSTFERSYFDIRVTHPHAASNVTKTLKQLYARDEKRETNMKKGSLSQKKVHFHQWFF